MSEQFLITGSPKTTHKTANTGNTLHNNPFLARQNQANQQTGVMPHYGGGAEKCARCSKNVYLAEKKVGAGRSFHLRCFSCQTCNRKLDATTLSEHKGEIYCKTCYTRQFGVHGLVSGVTMSTENPALEVRHSRRSSYGSDLDAPVITHQQSRPRAHSNDNMLRGETSAVRHDELPKLFPWRNDVIPDDHSPPKTQINHGVDHLVDKTQQQRPISQIGFGGITESDHNGETDQHKYGFQSEKTFYTNGTSAIIDMPVVSPPKRVESTIDRIEMPLVSPPKRMDSTIERYEMPAPPTRNDQRSRSPSPTSNDTYRRQSSRENHSDISDNFSRLTLNDNQKYSNGITTTNTIATQNPIFKQTDSYTMERNHSRDSSPSANANSNRSPSPTSGYASSSVHGEGILRGSTSPPAAHVPQHDYLNIRSSTSSSNGHVADRQSTSSSNGHVADRQSTSSSNGHVTDRQSTSSVHDFVSKTNTITSPPKDGGKYSTIAALIKPHRPLSQQNNPSDDEFDN